MCQYVAYAKWITLTNRKRLFPLPREPRKHVHSLGTANIGYEYVRYQAKNWTPKKLNPKKWTQKKLNPKKFQPRSISEAHAVSPLWRYDLLLETCIFECFSVPSVRELLDDETNDPEYNFIAENEQEEEDEEERRCDKGVEITSKLWNFADYSWEQFLYLVLLMV